MMFTVYCKCFFRNKVTIISFFILLIVRLYQHFFDNSISRAAEESFFELYAYLTSIHLATFILCPLFCLFILNSIRLFSNVNVIIRMKSHDSIVYKYTFIAFVQSIIYVLFINVTAFSVIILYYPISLDVTYFVLFSLVAQIIFFMVCNLLFFFIYTLTNKSYVAFVVTIIYIVWDFITNFVPMELPGIGWGLTQSQICDFNLQTISYKIAFLVFMCVALIIANLILTKNVNYLKKNEGEHDA